MRSHPKMSNVNNINLSNICAVNSVMRCSSELEYPSSLQFVAQVGALRSILGAFALFGNDSGDVSLHGGRFIGSKNTKC